MNHVKISIIIPFTRPHSATKTINSVLTQTREGDYEIIVVGMEASRLREFFHQREIILVDTKEKTNPSEARNIGAIKSRGKLLLFIDDDCEAGPAWLEGYKRHIYNPEIGIITGMVKGRSKRFFARCFDLNFYLQKGRKERELKRFSSITFGMRREVFDKLCGFDNKIIVREDIDLARRATSIGYRILYTPEILVIHDHNRDTLNKYLFYSYSSGLLCGLSVSFKHKKGWKDLIKIIFKRFYILLILPAAIWSTCVQTAGILKVRKNVIPFLPFMFLANLFYQIGVFKWTIASKA
ncbi:MAG: glycosyltransferase [Candidatus Omnitrophica bacterium]|nr:glycosyltransferase [Candidatus Omnitrophota bacterium]